MASREIRSLLAIIVLLGVTFNGTNADPLLTLVTLDGPSLWPIGCILGDPSAQSLVPHESSLEAVLRGILEGFPASWEFPSEGGLLEGQGNLMSLARNAGWQTAIFSAASESLNSIFDHVGPSAARWTDFGNNADRWRSLVMDYGTWAASFRTKRFAWIHLSLESLPAGASGTGCLIDFWKSMKTMQRSLSEQCWTINVYLPDPLTPSWTGGTSPMFVILDNPKDMRFFGPSLSTLDISPTIADALGLIYSPDYPGQSLAAWTRVDSRIEPLRLHLDDRSILMGSRLIMYLEPAPDRASAPRFRLYDLWAGRFTTFDGEQQEAIRLARMLVELQNTSKER